MDDVVFSYADPNDSPVKRKLIHLVEAATGQRKLKRIYLEQRRYPVASESFFQSAVRRLAIDVRFDARTLGAAPKTGPLVVVANHPYGVLDGIVIAWLVEKIRSDFLVLTNAVLLRAPELQAYLLPVDFSGTPAALETNIASRAAARAHLDRGGCVVVFPAGGVSTAPDRFGRHPAMDAPWQPFTAQLIHRARATVLPVCFGGQNSRLFQIASHLSQTLRISLIFHEVRKRIGTSMDVAVGAPIPYAALDGIRDRQALADHLRAATYALSAGLMQNGGEPGLRRRLSLPIIASRMRQWRGRLRRAPSSEAQQGTVVAKGQPRPR